MNHSTQQFDDFYVIGIVIETTHENAPKDIGPLWQQFFSQDILNQIPNKVSSDVYAIYTNYEGNYLDKYTTIIGCRVKDLNAIPEGLIGKKIQGGTFQKFLAKGAMPAAVEQTWQRIWKEEKKLNRAYVADFEVYGQQSQNGDQSEVSVFVGVR